MNWVTCNYLVHSNFNNLSIVSAIKSESNTVVLDLMTYTFIFCSLGSMHDKDRNGVMTPILPAESWSWSVSSSHQIIKQLE